MKDIAAKMRRALKNKTGLNLTFEQVHELAMLGFVNRFNELEVEELCHDQVVSTFATPTGSTSVETADPHTGKLPSHAAGQLYIEALAR